MKLSKGIAEIGLGIGKMGLIHTFRLIDSDYEEVVEVEDTIFIYIMDSFEWIESCWNGKKIKKGLSYYGFSYIEPGEVEKLMHIFQCWEKLFRLGTDKIILKGNFDLDVGKYEKNIFLKTDLIDMFEQLIDLCQRALLEKIDILYEGI